METRPYSLNIHILMLPDISGVGVRTPFRLRAR